MIARALVAAVALTLSCGYDASFRDCAIACTAASGCPAGFSCGAEGLCRSGDTSEPCAAIQPDSSTCSAVSTSLSVTWDLSGQDGAETAVAGSASSGLTTGLLARSSDLVAATGTGSINSTGFPIGTSLDPTVGYYTFTVAPAPGCTLVLSNASIDTQTSAEGPAAVVLATSVDGFAQVTSLTPTSVNTPTLAVSAATEIEVRVFGYAATTTTGSMRIENTLTLVGALH